MSTAAKRLPETSTGPQRVARKAPTSPPKLRYVVATLAGIFAILIGQLGLSIALGSGAYELRDLERQLAERNRDLSIVSEEIGQLQDPQTLAQLAVTLGMVDDGDPAYLRLSDAHVIGSTEAARASGPALVEVVPGEPRPSALAAAAAVVSQPAPQGESLPAFAALDDETINVTSATDSLQGLPSLVPEPTSTPTPQPTLGGDLPAPVTR